MTKPFSINGREIGSHMPPYIIAEMSANHNGNIENAFNIIKEAKKAGANAVKLQTYRADTITLDCDLPDFQITEGLWAGRKLYELYEWAHTPWEWHKPLFDYANQQGITIFSSPFDKTAIDLLEDLNSPAYKIASFEAIDLPLIKYAASTKKPIIISTGLANLEEIQEAVETAQQGGCEQIAVLHCVSGYPAPPSDYNLLTIPEIIRQYGLATGLSDHTLDNTTAITSVALGVSLIEKHFTLNRRAGGPDDSFSLEPRDLRSLCSSTKTAWEAIGKIDFSRKSSEKDNIKFRRSLYFIKDMNAGEKITPSCIKSVRPGYGISPKYIENVIGRRLLRDVKFGHPVTEDSFE